MADGLRLTAQGPEDLEVLSAALQDGVLKIGEASYDGRARRFVIQLNRFQWEEAGPRGPYRRRRAVLAVDGAASVKTAQVQRGDKDAVAVVLALQFEPDPEPPGGALRVLLAGGGEIRVTVECLDLLLVDTGPSWNTPHKPFHGRR